jgi:uncharacterized membrane protein
MGKYRPLLIFTLAYFALRLPLLNAAPWYDEVFTWHVAQLPWSQVIPALAGDVHPPFYYILAWFLAQLLGPAIWVIRLPALLAGYFGLITAWVVLKEVGPAKKKILWPIMALLTLSPFMIYYSVEGRMYTLLLYCVMLATLGAIRADWKLLGLGLGFGLLTHSLMVIYAPVLLLMWGKDIYTLGQLLPKREAYLNGLRPLALAGLIYLPWLPYAWQQVTRVSADYWLTAPTLGRVAHSLSYVVVLDKFPPWAAYHVPLAVLFFCFLGCLLALKSGQYTNLALLWGPVLILLALSYLIQPVYLSRVLVGVAPFVAFMVVSGITCQVSGVKILSTGLLSTVLLLSLLTFYSSPLRTDRAYYQTIPIEAGQTCYHIEPDTLMMAGYYHPDCDHLIWFNPAGYGSDSLSQQTITALGYLPPAPTLTPDWLLFSWGPTTPSAEYKQLEKLLTAHPQAELWHKSDDSGLAGREIWRIK